MTIMTTKNRWPIYIAVAATFLVLCGIVLQSKPDLSTSAQKYWPFQEAQAESALLAPVEGDAASFYEIALKHGTDKVTAHSYQDMYENYLPAWRYKKLKFLEIGLGCDMNYGPGKSYEMWLEYFPEVELYFLEYDAACAAQWAHKTARATVITGDQGSPVVLENLVAQHGPFDIIVDDGGHTMAQQEVSLVHLWKAINPGGIYFCEDLQTSYWERFGGGDVAAKAGTLTMMQFISKLNEDLTWGPRRIDFPDVESMVHIDCSKEVCGFFKREKSNP